MAAPVVRSRGPVPPHHHDIPAAQFTCGWADGSRRGCGERAVRAVMSRTGRVLFLCDDHEHDWNRQKAEERAASQREAEDRDDEWYSTEEVVR